MTPGYRDGPPAGEYGDECVSSVLVFGGFIFKDTGVRPHLSVTVGLISPGLSGAPKGRPTRPPRNPVTVVLAGPEG